MMTKINKTTWCENYSIPDKIKNRLVLENCEHSYSVKDVLDILNSVMFQLYLTRIIMNVTRNSPRRKV